MASSKREKELARQRAERQAARRTAADAKRKQRNAVIASVVAVLLVVAAVVGTALAVRGGSDATPLAGSTPDPTASPAPSAAPSAEPQPSTSAGAAASAKPAAGSCTYTKTPDAAARQVPLPPETGVEMSRKFTVTLATSRGDVVFDIDSAKAPCTDNSFRSLAHFAYFDDTPCHRLTTKGIEVLQCGDPTGTGGGGPGYQFADENLTGAKYPRGTVAMANAGPGTNGSQFFLVYGDSTLPPQYTPFGTITSGLDVLDAIAKGGSDDSSVAGDGKPKLPIQIKTVRITAKKA